MFQKNKEGKLSHIVSVRKKWREEIRNIDSSLNDVEFKAIKRNKNGKAGNVETSIRLGEIRKNIADLEVRLNTRGMLDESDFTKDEIIWDIIDEVYKCETCDEIVESDALTRLRRNLSLLLKMDWERSKTETVGNSIKIQLYMFLAIARLVMSDLDVIKNAHTCISLNSCDEKITIMMQLIQQFIIK